MPDASGLLNGDLGNILNFVGAAGAIGTAAYGLVDSTKAFAGGISNVGFGRIRRAVGPLIGRDGPSVFGKSDVIATLHANWINGVAKADQKATAKSLIRMAVTPENAERLAAETGVDGEKLRLVAEKVRSGQKLLDEEITVLGRFDVVVSAVLDEAYERADQQYRNASKLAGAIIAVLLSIVAGAVIYLDAHADGTVSAYLGTHQFFLAVLIGLVSTPLAPVAKDLTSALSSVVKAVKR